MVAFFYRTRAYLFSPNEGLHYVFEPKILYRVIYFFFHLILVCKVFINLFSKHQFGVLFFHSLIYIYIRTKMYDKVIEILSLLDDRSNLTNILSCDFSAKIYSQRQLQNVQKIE